MNAAIDPSLCAAEPVRDRLDDGFAPPAGHPQSAPPDPAAWPAEPALGDQSPF